MYSIFVNDLCIFDDTSSDLSLKLMSANLSLEDNSAGSLEMVLPITNIGYDQIVRMRSHIVVKRDGVKIWGGRPLSESEDFYKNKTIYCEGELAYLNDTYQPLEEYYGLTLRQFIQVVLHVHNNKCNGDENYTSYSNRKANPSNITTVGGKKVIVPRSTYDFKISYDEAEEVGSSSQTITDGNGEASSVTGNLDKRIYVGTITVNDTTNNEYRCTNFTSTMETLAGLVERLGGHMRVRTGNDGKLYLDYLRDFPNRAVQTVQLAKNLLDYRKDYDMANLCTVLLPLGAKKNEGDILGDEVKTHWNRRSFMDSSGRCRLGKRFHSTVLLPVKKYTVWQQYDSSTGRVTEQKTQNRLYITLEQVGGQYYCFFYNGSQNAISGSGKVAQASSSTGTQRFNNSLIDIPEDASYVAFGYYFGGPTSKVSFTARYEANGITTTYSSAMLRNGSSICIANSVLDENGNYKASMGDDYVVSNQIKVKEKETYYITSRQDSGFGMYCVYNDKDMPLSSPQVAGTGVGFTDWEENKVEMPAGASYIIVAGRTDVGMNPRVNASWKSSSEHYEPPDEYVTIEEVNDGKLYIQNDALIARYGWIEKQATWDDMDTPEKLLARANEYLATTQFDEMVLEIKAYDLHLVDRNASAINILDKVQCLSSAHELDRTLPVTKLEIPLLDPANATYTLGEESATPSLTGTSASSDSEIFRKLSEVPNPSSVLSSAKANATEILNMQSESYISQDGGELLIMDAQNKEDATRLWRFNVNGIGYSSEGYAGTYGLALTMDGSIVADRITTGYMHADRIRGGILTLGGYDNVSGEFYMKNELGKNFVAMTKDGADMICRIRQPITWETSTSTPKYGLVEYDKGEITGYTATIKAKVADENDTDWFKNYSFSFDDVTKSTAYTKIKMMQTLWTMQNGSKGYGIEIASANGFTVRCNGINSIMNVKTPQLRLCTNGDGALIFGSASSAFVGIRYWNADTDFSSGDDSYNAISPKTLVIKNDATYSGASGIGVGGVYVWSKNGPVSLEGSRIYIKGNYLNIYKGETLLTGETGTINVVTKINSDGTYNWQTVKITNGFVTKLVA